MSEWPRGKLCGGCAGRKGTEARANAQTMQDFEECVKTGEPFYCHESIATPDPNGAMQDKHGNKYTMKPQSQWRLCRAWMRATI